MSALPLASISLQFCGQTHTVSRRLLIPSLTIPTSTEAAPTRHSTPAWMAQQYRLGHHRPTARTGSVVLPVECSQTRRRLTAGESSGSNKGYERLEIAMREVRTTPTNSFIIRTSAAYGYSLSCHTYPAGVAQFALPLWLLCQCGGGDLHGGLPAFIPNRIHHVAAWLGEQHTFFVGNPEPPGEHTVGSHVANTISCLRSLFPPDLAAHAHPPSSLLGRVILA